MSLYTQSGQKIYNPEAYAKTGAPMYKTKYTESKNINEKTYIYKLDLENGKKYVGKTNNVDRRMDQHFKGNGAQVTKKFKPIEGEVIDSCNGYFSNNIEQKHTEKYINKHGYNNVRGGSYTNSKTLKYSNKFNTKKCKRCGNTGHYMSSCYVSYHIKGYKLSISNKL
jgi:hypothetical protein